MIEIFLALGTNLGNREENLTNVIHHLTAHNIISDVKKSNIYESEALLLPESPLEWELDFLNMAISGYTTLSPHDLLIEIKKLEKLMGRDLETKKWSPRLIDIDIIFYNDILMNEKDLVIPHPRTLERDFVLKPLWDLEKSKIYPGTDKTIEELCETRLCQNSKLKLWESSM